MRPFDSARAFFRDPVGFVAANGDRDGTPIQLSAPGARFLVVRRPEAIWQVLTGDATAYAQGRWKKRARRYVGPALNTLEGDEHRSRRMLVQPALDRRRVATFADATGAIAAEAVESWPRGDVDLRSLLDPVSVRMASKVLFSVDPGADAVELARALRVVMESLPRLVPPLPGTARSLALAEVHAFVRDTAAEQRTPGDLLDLLAAAGLPEETVRGDATAFLLAAADEPPSALAAIVHLVDGATDVESRLAAELDQATSWDQLEQLPVLEAVLREAVRLFPPARHVDRCPRAATVVDGVSVRAGTNVLISPVVTHHDPALWPEPEAFRPERWLDGAAPARGAYIPFGAGPHTCIGEPLARLIVKQVLHAVLPRWRMRVLPGSGAPVPGAAPMRVRLEER